MKKTLILSVVFAALLVVAGIYLVTSPPSENSSGPVDEVTVQLKWKHQAQFAGFYAADQQGYYADEGIKVNLVPGGVGIDLIDEVVSGNAEFGVAGADNIIEARVNNQPVKAIAVNYQKNPAVLYSKKEANIVRPQDLVGKTVGVQTGTSSERAYRAMLKNLGIDESLINEVEIGFDLEPFFNDEIDVGMGYTINEPIFAEENGYEVNNIVPDDYGAHFYSDTIFTSETLIENDPDLVRRFLSATLKGWEYAVEHPVQTARYGLEYDPELDVDHEIAMMEASIPLIVTGEFPIGWMTSEEWMVTSDHLFESTLINQQPDISQVFTTEFFE